MLQIDILSRVPVYEQIIDQIETLIATGAMKAGDQLPSVRGLSVEILVNPNTIQKAYTELDNLGIVTSVPGRGCFVSQNAPEMLRRRGTESLSELYALAKRLNSLWEFAPRSFIKPSTRPSPAIPPTVRERKAEL